MTQVVNDQFGTRIFNVSTVTNRLLGIGSTVDNWTYSGAGNTLTANGGAIQFNWDAVNMLTRYREGSKDFVSVYGPGDYRVWVEDVSTGKKYWTSRGAGGKILREFEVTGNGGTWKHIRDFLYGAEGIVASVDHDGTEFYYHSDHLGTPRLKTTAAGLPFSEHHYYAYGLDANFSRIFEDGFETGDELGWEKDNDVLSVKYTGHERERFKNLDYMLGRHYSHVTNRFMSVDPARDGWNLYSYVRNNPIGNVDPDGLYTCTGDASQCSAFETARQQNLADSDQSISDTAAIYGDQGVDNGIVVAFVAQAAGAAGEAGLGIRPASSGGMEVFGTVAFDPAIVASSAEFVAAVGHEGQHVIDAKGFTDSFSSDLSQWDDSKNLTNEATETAAYTVAHKILIRESKQLEYGGAGKLGQGIRPRRLSRELAKILNSATYSSKLTKKQVDFP